VAQCCAVEALPPGQCSPEGRGTGCPVAACLAQHCAACRHVEVVGWPTFYKGLAQRCSRPEGGKLNTNVFILEAESRPTRSKQGPCHVPARKVLLLP